MEERGETHLLEFWQARSAQYVQQCRIKSGKVQKELDASRKTVSAIENASVNFTLSTLLEVLESVDGNISDAFAIRVPRKWRGPDELLHERLQFILSEGSEKERLAAEEMIEALAERIQRKRSA